MNMKNLEAKLSKARQEANDIYDTHGLGVEFEAAMDTVRDICEKIDNMTDFGMLNCESDGKWWA